MRKLSATQVAAMAASMGMCAVNTARVSVPLMALAPTLSHSQTYTDDEIEEVVVTSTPIYDVVVYPTPAGGGGGGGGGSSPPAPAPAPIARVTSQSATSSVRQAAMRCGARYSARVAPAGTRGQAPGWTTTFISDVYAWGSASLDPPVVYTVDTTSPGGDYQLIDGWTKHSSSISFIYERNVQMTASASGISYQAALINVLAHEWVHQWGYLDNVAGPTGDAAQAAYIAAGGSGARCNSPPRDPTGNGRK